MNQPAPSDRDVAHDSLAMVAEQDRQLTEIFAGWDGAAAGLDVDNTGDLIRSTYERGTYGKLLIAHAALRAAAKRDVARVLYDTGSGDLADEFLRKMADVRRLVDRLDELARGVNAMGIAASKEFAVAVGDLAALLRADLDTERARVLPRIEAALGHHRDDLHSEHWVRHHAPTHPRPRGRWYTRVPVLVRIQACYDHLRGFPWATSAPLADPKAADSLDTEP